MSDLRTLKNQYQLVKGSRAALLTYCKTISPSHFTNTTHHFGDKSISYLLGHICNCYFFWIGEQLLDVKATFIEDDDLLSILAIEAQFIKVDWLMETFFQLDKVPSEIHFETKTTKGISNPLAFFSHVITHEFHHKGQILTLTRHLGYTPVDTDIMR